MRKEWLLYQFGFGLVHSWNPSTAPKGHCECGLDIYDHVDSSNVYWLKQVSQSTPTKCGEHLVGSHNDKVIILLLYVLYFCIYI